jgi:PIN domain
MKHTYLDQSIDDEPRVKVLLDADVLLELFVNRSGFVEDIERLLAEIETSRQVEVYITDKCLKRIRIEDELGDEASSFVEEMVRGRVIKIDSDIRALARVSCLQDYDSAEELACANARNLDAIITQNPQNFDGSTLPIWSVADLLNRVLLEKSLEKACEYQDLQQGLFVGSFNIIYFTGHGTSDDIDVSNIRKILEAARPIFLNACSSGTTKTFTNRRKDCIAVINLLKYTSSSE